MAAAELLTPQNDELERVEHWRAEELERAGYAPNDASLVASRHDIDLHRAVEIVRRGCPHELALRILL
jgi:hypothetical protein